MSGYGCAIGEPWIRNFKSWFSDSAQMPYRRRICGTQGYRFETSFQTPHEKQQRGRTAVFTGMGMTTGDGGGWQWRERQGIMRRAAGRCRWYRPQEKTGMPRLLCRTRPRWGLPSTAGMWILRFFCRIYSSAGLTFMIWIPGKRQADCRFFSRRNGRACFSAV